MFIRKRLFCIFTPDTADGCNYLFTTRGGKLVLCLW